MLEPVDAFTTRLLVRMRVSYRPAAKWAPTMWLLVEPAYFVMGRRQLLGTGALRPPGPWPPAAHGSTRGGSG